MLTELQCRSARGREKPYKLSDSLGLYLFVTKAGFRSWRFKYRWDRKEKVLVLGAYPDMGLKGAREARDEARRMMRSGRDPGAKTTDDGPSFEAYARGWHADQAPLWKEGHAAQVLASFENDVFPAIGAKPIADVRPSDVKKLLLAIQDRGSIDIAHRARARISRVFRKAVADELVEFDPAAAIASVLKPVRKRRYPALVKLKDARAFLEQFEREPAHPVTKLASRLVALTAVRPGVIRFTPRLAEFSGLDGDAPTWTIPAPRMKLELNESEDEAFDFVVPLSRQAAEVVRVAQRLAGRSEWLFPSIRFARRPISENTLSYAYARLMAWRGRHVPHGWRSSFSSIMNERAATHGRHSDADVIELMLAHRIPGVRGIYMRAGFMDRRREIAQEWADALLKGLPPAAALLEGPRH